MTARRAPIAVAALAFAFGLTACTNEVGGQATASSSPAGTTAPATNSTTADPGNPFAGLSPCTIVDQALAGLGFPKAEPTVADAKESCRASKPSSVSTQGADVAVSLQPGLGYRDNVGNPSQASEGNVNGRPAVEEREPLNVTGQCGVWLEVKPSSRALVLVASGSDTTAACKLVEEVSPKVESQLPKNN
ncbi:DUF3558 family protein [Amycolatopsis sp. cmx-4-68]|uniref:DUF3558 family protein n=1 Tax=Amycolatopsis sp. cmx-4-68 TaxID=2790938 RepID=UPI00397C6987